MDKPPFDPDQAPTPKNLDAWQQHCQEREAQFQEWLERQRENEQQDQESQSIEQQRQYEQRKHDDQRRNGDQRRNQQARVDEQRKREADHRKPEKHTATTDDQRILERAMYDRHQQKITEENRSISEPKQGLDRHDWYNIDTAHELEGAMSRARSQGINPAHEKQVQKFLDREAEQGTHQTEGKRSLSERYKELRERRDEAIQAMQQGARVDQIPSMKLYESTWEQAHRLRQERQAFQENREWAQHLDTRQAQWSQKTHSPARERLAEIRASDAQTIERTPARENLDQTRAQFDINSEQQSEDRFKGKFR